MTDGPLSAWIEWKKLCALALCSDSVKTHLQHFAGSRFQSLVRKYIHLTNQKEAWRVAEGVPPDMAWHLFETHLRTQTTSRGTRYKDWLFVRARSAPHPYPRALELGASLIMRDVVRRLLCAEFSPPETVSLDLPIHEEGRTLALVDLMPGTADPVDETSRHECETLAGEHGQQIFEEMTHRERLVLLAKHLGIALSNVTVEKAADCGKSMLSAAYRALLMQIGETIKKAYPDDDSDSVMALALMTIEAIKHHVEVWGKSEIACAPLFLLIEGRTEKNP